MHFLSFATAKVGDDFPFHNLQQDLIFLKKLLNAQKDPTEHKSARHKD